MSRINIAKFNPDTKVWTGPVGKYPYSLDTFFGELIIEALDKNSEKIIQINHDSRTEWIAKDLKMSSIRVAQSLAKLGVKPDDVVGFNATYSENVNPLIIGCVLAVPSRKMQSSKCLDRHSRKL